MRIPYSGAIDCDIHPALPGMSALLPYLNEYWREQITNRYIDRSPFTLTSYSPTSPLSARPDWRAPSGLPAGDIEALRSQALDPFGSQIAILNPLHGAIALFNEDMAAALCRAVNDWVTKNLLDPEPRLRASILVAMQNPALAAAEIERLAPDHRFVQVLLPVMGDMPLGRRFNWPIFQAAEKHGLAIGVHAGSTYRHAPTNSGWPSYQLEDYVAQSAAFENQLVSLLAEGVFQQFPGLKVVLMESGITWLPTLLWRTNKTWRGVRTEVPWIDRSPAEIVRDQVRFTLQPFDAPPDPKKFIATLEHIGSDRVLLFSTDYPHWNFDDEDVLPDGLGETTIRRILVDNALETYRRLREYAVDAKISTTKEIVS